MRGEASLVDRRMVLLLLLVQVPMQVRMTTSVASRQRWQRVMWGLHRRQMTILVTLKRQRRRRLMLLLLLLLLMLPQALRWLLHRRLTRLATWLLPLGISHCLRSMQRR